MSDSNDDVLRWLHSRPFQDNPERLAPTTSLTTDTWDEWLQKRREIPDSENRLIQILEHDRDPVNRSAAALALGFVEDQVSVIPLIRALQGDAPMVAMEAAAALGRLGRPEAVEPLCQALKKADANVRANACTALGALGGEKAVACLRDGERDQDPFVQSAAREALGRNK